MSKLETNQVDPSTGTTLTLGTSGDTIAIPSGVTIANSGTATGFSTPGISSSADATAMTISSNENIGIGITDPDSYDSTAHELVVGKTDAESGMTIRSNSTTGNLYFADGTTGAEKYQGYVQYDHNNGRLNLGALASNRMIIDGGGGVGINTTPDSNNFLLKVTHDGNSKYALNANSSNASGTQYHIVFQRNGSTAGYITSNSATTIAVNNASDQRLKENIQNSGSAIQDIKDIQVRQFDWIDAIDTHRDFGFVAQELINVVPEAVTQGTDELDENGKPVRSWGVDYSHIVPRLVKVCQEQQTKIEQLEARITTLENA